MRSLFTLSFFLVTLDGLVNVELKAFDFLGEAFALLIKLSNRILHVVLALLGHQRLAHTVSN